MRKKITGYAVVCIVVCVLFLSSFGSPFQISASGFDTTTIPTMQDYWSGRADWKLTQKITRNTPYWKLDPDFVGGTQIVPVGNTWYLFSRKSYYSDRNQGVSPNCQNHLPLGNGAWVSMGTVVRSSIDKGASWSDPVDVIVPTTNKPWECAATDGSAYYDTSSNKWHFLFQCMDGNGGWDGCHLEKSGPNPMGLFQETHANPVIQGGALWNTICNNPGKKCNTGKTVKDEGTFNIFAKIGGYYYVAFHGTDTDIGFRSFAKTNNFINWIAGDNTQGLPTDATFSKQDQLNWRESWVNPVGPGAGSILYDNGWYYSISEYTDVRYGELAARFDWGLSRSQTLTNLNWEQYPMQNPIFYSYTNYATLGYGHLFKDPSTNKIYFAITHTPQPPEESHNGWGLFIYELQKTNNFLVNGNFWKCNIDNWTRNTDLMNMNVYRLNERSSDGRCYLAFNCGTSSCISSAISQEVPISPSQNSSVQFGGKFAKEEGTGTLEVAIQELNNSNAVINEYKASLSLSSEYESHQQSISLNPETRKLKYMLLPKSEGTFKADELFISSTQTSQRSADIDGLNGVDIVDFNIWRDAFIGTRPDQRADINGVDGVDIVDFNIWRDAFLQS